ncbi:formyltransferase family protein [Baekduia sp. Peel2402]|uniref:formyltransferase family protein n=1 Tax=Baekduia sp. Peel2402 TaxID=3458296 RepID=UPI00403E9420
MPVLFLGRDDSRVLAGLRAAGEEVVALGPDADVAPETFAAASAVVSHGYRRILRADVLDAAPGPVVNLHIALLPYNRGADPTLWSVLEDTPSGVTIHHVDAGVDTGDVIAQRAVLLAGDDTLATAYARLQEAMAALFAETWPAIASGTAPRAPQPPPPSGTVHRVADRAAVEHLLTAGWDTPVAALRGRLRRA